MGMTNQEAAEMLRNDMKIHHDYLSGQYRKALNMAIDAMLKEHEAVEPYMDYDGHDVWRCGNCGATIFHIEHSQADEDWKSYAKFCRQCGKKVKWDD